MKLLPISIVWYNYYTFPGCPRRLIWTLIELKPKIANLNYLSHKNSTPTLRFTIVLLITLCWLLGKYLPSGRKLNWWINAWDRKQIYFTYVWIICSLASSLSQKNRRDLIRVQKVEFKIILGKKYITYKHLVLKVCLEKYPHWKACKVFPNRIGNTQHEKLKKKWDKENKSLKQWWKRYYQKIMISNKEEFFFFVYQPN